MTMAVIVCTGFILDCCFHDIIFVKLQLPLFIISVEPLDCTIGRNHPVSHHIVELQVLQLLVYVANTHS